MDAWSLYYAKTIGYSFEEYLSADYYEMQSIIAAYLICNGLAEEDVEIKYSLIDIMEM